MTINESDGCDFEITSVALGLGRRPAAEGGVGPLGFIEGDPRGDAPFGLRERAGEGGAGELAALVLKISGLP